MVVVRAVFENSHNGHIYTSSPHVGTTRPRTSFTPYPQVRIEIDFGGINIDQNARNRNQ